MTLGTHLREKRKAIKLQFGKRLSIENMAELVPCSKSYLWAVEKDQTIPTLLLAKCIARAYKTTVAAMARELP